MYITHKLIDFINSSSTISHSTIVLTDWNSVILVSSNSTDDSILLNRPISNDLKNVLLLFSSDVSSTGYMNSRMDFVIPVTSNDSCSKYISQIILPIVHDGSTDGLLIFMADDRIYIESNLKFAKTTKHFAELLSCSNYL